MKIPRSVSEFREWLKAEIAELSEWIGLPEIPLNLCEDAAATVKNAYRLAVSLELWDAATKCEVRTEALALPVARRMLVRCLAALQDAATEQPEFLTVKDAAARLNVSERTVYDLVRQGRLHAQRAGKGRGAIRIAPADLANISQPTRRLRHL